MKYVQIFCLNRDGKRKGGTPDGGTASKRGRGSPKKKIKEGTLCKTAVVLCNCLMTTKY